MSRDEFIAFLTRDAPEIPRYFPMDVEINRRGAASLDSADAPPAVAPGAFKALCDSGAVVLDVRATADYLAGSVPKSLNIGLGGQFASWAGTLIDANRKVLIVAANEAGAAEARMRLSRVGLDNVVGWLAEGILGWKALGLPVATTDQVSVRELHDSLSQVPAESRRTFQVVDVRRPGEWSGGHIAEAIHAPLHVLEDHVAYLDPTLRTYVVCGGGYRSVMGAEILRELGVRDVVDVRGGMAEWQAQGLPTTIA